jgi:hypothetical protein
MIVGQVDNDSAKLIAGLPALRINEQEIKK